MSDICVWTVEFSVKQTGQTYRRNKYVTVVTTTAQRALELIVAENPTAMVHALHMRSRGEMLIDPDLQIKEMSDGIQQDRVSDQG